jgi:hypothetical protein
MSQAQFLNSKFNTNRQVVLATKTKMPFSSANKLILILVIIAAQRIQRTPPRLKQFSQATVGWKQEQLLSLVRHTSPET